jgi:hypothetical protein
MEAGTVLVGGSPKPSNPDGQHGFDWEFGRWTVHLKRLVHPLSGSQQWSEYNGTLDVSKIWDGRANTVQFEADNTNDHIEGLSVRLFNPKTHQWSISWASAADGLLDSTPVAGGFENGRGEFFGFQQYSGRWVLVRFIFSGIQTRTVHGEQSYSADGGKTWEANWVEDLTRE